MNSIIPFVVMMAMTVCVFCLCRSSEGFSQEDALAEIEKLHQTDMAAANINDI